MFATCRTGVVKIALLREVTATITNGFRGCSASYQSYKRILAYSSSQTSLSTVRPLIGNAANNLANDLIFSVLPSVHPRLRSSEWLPWQKIEKRLYTKACLNGGARRRNTYSRGSKDGRLSHVATIVFDRKGEGDKKRMENISRPF